MARPESFPRVSRRAALRLGAGGIALAALARPVRANPWESLAAAREAIGATAPVLRGLTLELPLVSEDGASVPLAVRADGPMRPEDHIESIHLFAARNPSPEIAEFRFTPLGGRAQLATRVRLAETQSVIAIARTSTGEVRAAAREVRITTSGCLARTDTYASEDEMQVRVRVPERARPGEPVEVLTLINHPMETGLREVAGKVLPQRIIRAFAAELGGKPVIDARLYRSVSANPYLRFFVAPREAGELKLRWTEDTGRTALHTAKIVVG